MEIKLEITGVKTLTLEQRKAIQQKLVEIKAIIKNKETKAESPASRTIKKWLEKWDKRLSPHSIDVELTKPKIYCTNSIEDLVESVAKNSNLESIVCYAAVVIDVNPLSNEHLQTLSSPKGQNEPLQDDIIPSRSHLVQKMFSRIRYCKNRSSNWITRPYSKDDRQVPQKPQ